LKILVLLSIIIFNSAFAIEVGKEIKEATLPIWKSEEGFDLQKELKKKKVVINFWASWCTACINELPELEELKRKHAGSHAFFAVNAGEKKIKIKKFLKKYNFSYKILLDKGRVFSKKTGVEELPRTLVIDQNGKVIFSGSRPPKEL
jgi:thiol-disulfide isomerase/thioredoxin